MNLMGNLKDVGIVYSRLLENRKYFVCTVTIQSLAMQRQTRRRGPSEERNLQHGNDD